VLVVDVPASVVVAPVTPDSTSLPLLQAVIAMRRKGSVAAPAILSVRLRDMEITD
jgi:hypothetical protein